MIRDIDFILLFGKASLDISANTVILNAKRVMSYQRTDLKRFLWRIF